MKNQEMRQALAVIAAFAAAALMIPGGTAFADTEEEKIYRLRNAESGEYLTVDGEMAQKEGNLITKEANGTLKQEFIMTGEDCVMLISQSNQRDLAVNVWGSRTEEGCNINLWEQTGEETQMWLPVPVKGGYVLRSADDTSCVMGTYHGNVQAEEYCRGDEDQIWELIEVKETGDEAVTALTIQAESSFVSRNHMMELELVCEPKAGNLRLLAWESSNPDVLSVDQDGMVTAKDNGTAVISAVLPDGIRADLALEVRDIEQEETELAGEDNEEEDIERHFVCSTPEEWEFLEMLGGEAYLIREDEDGNVWLPTEILDVQDYDESYEMVLHLGYLAENGEKETFELIDYEKYTTVLSDIEDWYEAVKVEDDGRQAPELLVDYEQLETGIWVLAKAADGSRYQYRVSANDFEKYRNGFQGEREVYYGWMQDGMISGLFQAEPIVVTEEMPVPETLAEEVTKPVSELTSEAEAPTEPVTEATTAEMVNEAPTELMPESTTGELPEPMTEAATEEWTELAEEVATEPETEKAETEPATEWEPESAAEETTSVEMLPSEKPPRVFELFGEGFSMTFPAAWEGRYVIKTAQLNETDVEIAYFCKASDAAEENTGLLFDLVLAQNPAMYLLENESWRYLTDLADGRAVLAALDGSRCAEDEAIVKEYQDLRLSVEEAVNGMSVYSCNTQEEEEMFLMLKQDDMMPIEAQIGILYTPAEWLSGLSEEELAVEMRRVHRWIPEDVTAFVSKETFEEMLPEEIADAKTGYIRLQEDQTAALELVVSREDKTLTGEKIPLDLTAIQDCIWLCSATMTGGETQYYFTVGNEDYQKLLELWPEMLTETEEMLMEMVYADGEQVMIYDTAQQKQMEDVIENQETE